MLCKQLFWVLCSAFTFIQQIVSRILVLQPTLDYAEEGEEVCWGGGLGATSSVRDLGLATP